MANTETQNVVVKKWYESKTVWVAILQSVSGILSGVILLLQQGFTNEALAAFGIGIKGLLDLQLRFKTVNAISK